MRWKRFRLNSWIYKKKKKRKVWVRVAAKQAYVPVALDHRFELEGGRSREQHALERCWRRIDWPGQKRSFTLTCNSRFDSRDCRDVSSTCRSTLVDSAHTWDIRSATFCWPPETGTGPRSVGCNRRTVVPPDWSPSWLRVKHYDQHYDLFTTFKLARLNGRPKIHLIQHKHTGSLSQTHVNININIHTHTHTHGCGGRVNEIARNRKKKG